MSDILHPSDPFMDDDSLFELAPESEGPGLWDEMPDLEQNWAADTAPGGDQHGAQGLIAGDYEWTADDFAQAVAADDEPHDPFAGSAFARAAAVDAPTEALLVEPAEALSEAPVESFAPQSTEEFPSDGFFDDAEGFAAGAEQHEAFPGEEAAEPIAAPATPTDGFAPIDSIDGFDSVDGLDGLDASDEFEGSEDFFADAAQPPHDEVAAPVEAPLAAPPEASAQPVMAEWSDFAEQPNAPQIAAQPVPQPVAPAAWQSAVWQPVPTEPAASVAADPTPGGFAPDAPLAAPLAGFGGSTEEVTDLAANTNWKEKWADAQAAPAVGAERVVASEPVIPHPLDTAFDAGTPEPEETREELSPALTRRLLMAAIATAAIVALLFVAKTVFGSSSSTAPAPTPTVATAPSAVAPTETTVAPLAPTTVATPSEAPPTTAGGAPAPTPDVVEFS